jgi:hypothetical protein
MAVSIVWKITRLEVVNKDGLENVAIQSCFDVKATEDYNGKELQGFAQGDVLLHAPDPSNFADITSVTEEQAVAWTKAALGDRVAEFEGRVSEQIGWQKKDQPKPADLPWMQSDAPAEVSAADAAV